MFNVGGGEILVIAVIALLLLGPDRLPEYSRKAGKALSELRKISDGFQHEMRQAMDLGDAAKSTSPGPRLVAPPPAAAPPAGGVGDADPGLDEADDAASAADPTDSTAAPATGSDSDTNAA